jgi:homoserine O-acetyltransferase/O-succinyltransferase
MTDLTAGLGSLELELGDALPLHVAYKKVGIGSKRILLLHALTGGPDAVDARERKGWWNPLFAKGAPLAFNRASTWTPNLIGSCYGSVGPEDLSPFPSITPRDQAVALLRWIESENLSFDVLMGGSLGGMVALELAILAPDLFKRVGVIGCGARSDAWIWGQHYAQRRILESALPDDQAIALARHSAMLSFRAPASLNARFKKASGVQDWIEHHGRALSERFSRASYLILLGAMDAHDISKGRGTIADALKSIPPLHVLGITTDTLFTPPLIQELADAAKDAGRNGSLTWLDSPHGHDAFLIEWDQVTEWIETHLFSEES